MTYPIALYLCALFLGGLIFEACSKFRMPWALPALSVYLTTLAWYFVDPFQSPDAYIGFLPGTISFSYFQVAVFLLVFRWVLPILVIRFSRRLNIRDLVSRSPDPGKLFWLLLGLWFPLLAIAIYRMGGDVIGGLFPLDGRTGNYMWARGSLGADYDAFISAGGYLYQLVCGLLGVTLVLQRSIPIRIANAAFWLLSLPHFLLSGTRSIFLAAIAPFFLTYLLVGKQKMMIRLTLIAVSFAAVYTVLLVVIENRNTGFHFLVNEEAKEEKETNDLENKAVNEQAGRNTARTQQGLNMIQELCFINEFSDSKVFSPDWGQSYYAQIANIVPRALWPNKPRIGIDYAILRGFADTNNSLGVAATIATGMIGSGIINFGVWLGPPAAALILAAWAGLLARWWQQRGSTLRFCLCMAGLGLTFNLGRDITLLVLWPVVFGYVIVRLAETFSQRRRILPTVQTRPLPTERPQPSGS